MGAMRPFGSDPRADPESYKRKRSGFWDHYYSFETGHDRWTCNVKKLREAVGKLAADRAFMESLHRHGLDRTLDMLFGEGTSKAYRTNLKGDHEMVRIEFPTYKERMAHYDYARDDRTDAMAYLYNTGTTSNTFTTTSGTADQWHSEFMRETIKEAQAKMINTHLGRKVAKADSAFKFRKKRVRNFPFVNGGDSLVKTLQREFDHWAGDQMKVIAS